MEKLLWYRLLMRFLRATVAVILAGLIVKYSDNALYIMFAPVFLVIDKWIRDTK